MKLKVDFYISDLPEFKILLQAIANNFDQIPEEVKQALEEMLNCKLQHLDS